MPLYEHVFLARQDVSSQQVEALTDQFKSVIEQAGGTIGKVENWGLKSLAYRIKKNRKAYFTLMNVEAPPAAIAEVERQQRLSEDVIRSLTIKVDAHEEGPSAMLQKRDRDERRDRDDRRGGRFGERPRGDRDRDGPRRDDGGERERETVAEAKSGEDS